MLKITEYGNKIVEEFIDYCKICDKYDIAMDHGLEILDECVRGVKDYAAWCIMSYDTMALDTVEEWFAEASSSICWSTNWDDPENSFFITFGSLRDILNRCFEEVREEMDIKMTFTEEEIKQIEEFTGREIKEKEDLYNATRLILDTIMSIRKGV